MQHVSHDVPGQEQNDLKVSNSASCKINLIHSFKSPMEHLGPQNRNVMKAPEEVSGNWLVDIFNKERRA